MQFDDRKLRAYRGARPYAFLSYSHKDKADAELITYELIDRGFRVWFDEGLTPAKEWDEVIAKRVEECSYFVALLSQNYLESENCRDELNYARDKNRPRMLIYLENVELPAGMAMRLLRNHALHKWEFESIPKLIDKAVTAEGFEVCRYWNFVPEKKPEPTEPAEPSVPEPEPEPKSGSKKFWPAIAVIAVLLAAVAVLIVFLYGKQDCRFLQAIGTEQSGANGGGSGEQSPPEAPAEGRMAELEEEWESADFRFSVGGTPHAVLYNEDGQTERVLLRRLQDGRFTICAEYRFTWNGDRIQTIERCDTAGNPVARHMFAYIDDWLQSDTIYTDGTVTGSEDTALEKDDSGNTVIVFPEDGKIQISVLEDPTAHDTYYEESMQLFTDGFVFFIGGYSNQTLTITFNREGQLADEAYMVGDPADAKYYDKQWRAIG